MVTIKAGMPGIFYRRPAPEDEPYVSEGGTIAAGQTIALIEVMKTYNEIRAEADGTIGKFLVEDGDEVEIGQDLAELETA
ncbi:acetyl-CoA carboxylase [Sciscionella marina]|uniref:acetyl-CoA carboxylase n=1 Tax=Sciscionella marina TaxID=508770 RepID=UPI00035D32CE|nr:acetyl-CoA carboxylase [Sciscionella marina]